MLNEISAAAKTAAEELIAAAKLKSGDIMVVGCSSSEVGGEKIGTHSSPDIAKALVEAVLPVLREKGIDSRRVICDDTAPIYHVGEKNKYSPMLFIVSDNDMQNRYEQTMLILSTLKHFGHGEDVVSLKEMHGGHCEYVGKRNADGVSVLGKIVENFIKK